MARITKQDIVAAIAEHDTFETKKAAGEVLDILLEKIATEVAAGNEVYLGTAFGGFKPATQAARSGETNGVAYSTPAKQVIKFKPSGPLKAQVAGA